MTRGGKALTQDSTRLHLFFQRRFQFGHLLPGLVLLVHGLASLLVQDLLLLCCQLLVLLLSQQHGVVVLVPAPERSGVHEDDAVLDQRLRSHQLVVGGIVHDVNDSGLSGNT